MVRNPPHVKKEIRQTDGFLCAYPDCTIPYLEYHHFDPPWKEKNHNNPKGIIALCPTHHRLADGGVFTKEQLKSFKINSPFKLQGLEGKILWLRTKVLLITGKLLYYENTFDIVFRDKPMIWFNYDQEGNRLLNIDIQDDNGKSRLKMIDNDWKLTEKPNDIECTPYGRKVSIEFDNNDFFEIKFKDINDIDMFMKEYSHIDKKNVSQIKFPCSVFNVNINFQSIGLRFDSSKSAIGNNSFSGVMANNTNGLTIN